MINLGRFFTIVVVREPDSQVRQEVNIVRREKFENETVSQNIRRINK